MKSILVVDDSHEIRESLAKNLASQGHRVQQASDGEAAVNLLLSSGGEIEVVITDLDMPKKDGLHVIGHSRDNFPDQKRVLMSRRMDESMKELALHLGADVACQKPEICEELQKLGLIKPLVGI